ncbi:sugar ABC transporter permease [Conexibacter sp. JD483]|uniref:carbohydrate ABC transporter permease n=1 Tax=unclassified Conexibacter TaxID=2627773 RepID=UPI0027275F2D|nr:MULTISPECIES: sugar ABC transporter permease [unclassified Conexibacter]MDO8188012.1 sugar ABC transporter permease [Conexibacter sp. CPCC 205706]MDO8200895.1 sugar ABC transporter permease [Conexibacter sp. CPCC 205762]MDR9370372.1 sugar ABC transporter permease [Conexibacter sp. JD483]
MSERTTAAPARPGRRRRRGGSRPVTRRSERFAGLLFVAPLVAMLAVFALLPLGRVVYYAFTRYDGLTPARWVGLENFKFLLEWHDFWRILLNNVVLIAGIVVWVAVPFTIAIVIFGQRRAPLVRTVLLLPALLPPIIIGGVFRLLLADKGPLNETLRSIGLGALAQPWLADDKLVLLSVIGVIGWATAGTGVMLYSAGLSTLSESYVEAAVLDGANWRQLVWHIYRPALRPVTRFWTLLLTVGTVTVFFPWIYGLTQGGPGIASTTLDYQVYISGIQDGRLGLGSAIAVVGIFLIVVLLLAQYAASRVRRAAEWTS